MLRVALHSDNQATAGVRGGTPAVKISLLLTLSSIEFLTRKQFGESATYDTLSTYYYLLLGRYIC